MKFLNLDRVLCLSAHPDDTEYGMLGSMMKFDENPSISDPKINIISRIVKN